MADTRPQDVGIVAMDIYFPKTTVNQTQLGTRIFWNPSFPENVTTVSLVPPYRISYANHVVMRSHVCPKDGKYFLSRSQNTFLNTFGKFRRFCLF